MFQIIIHIEYRCFLTTALPGWKTTGVGAGTAQPANLWPAWRNCATALSGVFIYFTDTAVVLLASTHSKHSTHQTQSYHHFTSHQRTQNTQNTRITS